MSIEQKQEDFILGILYNSETKVRHGHYITQKCLENTELFNNDMKTIENTYRRLYEKKYIESTEKRKPRIEYMCNICNMPTGGSKDTIAHYIAKHPEVAKQWDDKIEK